MAEKRLGRGLDYLLHRTQPPSETTAESLPSGNGPPATRVTLPLADLAPNPAQPRREFAPEALAELEASIREHGVIQPVVVRKSAQGYELVAGERRCRAARAAGLTEIPAVVREVTDEQLLALALVENLQREDLNPIETARGYRELMTTAGATQEAVARVMGKSRAAVANTLRLLDLPEDLQARVASGRLSAGHARALLAVADHDAMRTLAGRIEAEGLSVREAERAVTAGSTNKIEGTVSSPTRIQAKSPHLADLEQRLRRSLGTRVLIKPGRGKRGKITLYYASLEDFDRLFEILAGPAEPAPVEAPESTRYL